LPFGIVKMAGDRGGSKRSFALKLLHLTLATITLLSIATRPLLVVAAAEKDSSGKEDQEGVCEWGEDEEGLKKCKEEVHRQNEDEYLPDSGGGRDDLEDAKPENDNYWDSEEYKNTKAALYEELNCPDYDYADDEMFKNTSFENIHTVKNWQTFNRIYNEVIASTQDDDELRQESSIPPKFEKGGFQFPIEIKFVPILGRGVYATTNIPKGSLLYVSANTGIFYNGPTFRTFIRALPTNMACDVMIWSYVRWVSLESDYNDAHMVCVDLDEGSFVNSVETEGAQNMALGNDEGKLYIDCDFEEQRLLWPGCKMKFFASRDILAGEAIEASYTDFAEVDGWRYLGL